MTSSRQWHRGGILAIGLSLIALLALGSQVAIRQLNDTFTLQNIHASFPNDSRWDVSSPSLPPSLDQEFFYLGKGSQCYAFESADGTLVLKFFRENRNRMPKWAVKLTFHPLLLALYTHHATRKEKRRTQLFSSCRLAYEELQEACGLLYLHLNKTPEWEYKVVLLDRSGRKYHLNLGETAFFVQRKAQPLIPTLEAYLQKGEIEALQQSVEALQTLLRLRFERGIVDHDPYITKNAGLLASQAQFIDIGQFEKDERAKDPVVYEKEIHSILKRLKIWLNEQGLESSIFLK